MANAGANATSAKRSVVWFILRYFALVLIITLMIRAFFLESFTVTSGSMAPSLLGIHRQCACPKCGFPVVVGAPPADVDPVLHWQVRCPNCGQGDLGLENQPDRPGQWLLVDKNVYEWRSPRRWELVVFRGPNGTPYVKRVVGLPGETVQIKDGDVYINGELSRRTRDQIARMSFPVYEQDYFVPGRWCATGHVELGALIRFSCRDDRGSATLFAVDRNQPRLTDYFVYNGARVNLVDPVSDCWMTLRLHSQGQDGGMRIGLKSDETASSPQLVPIPAAGSKFPLRQDSDDRIIDKLTNGEHQLNMYDIDKKLTLVMDQQVIYEQREDRRPSDGPALAKFDLIGLDVQIWQLKYYRDTHYQSVGRHGIKTPCRLGPDEFFVLGDNSAVSDDSRMWPEPSVKRSALIGRPLR
jgi:signal peptidase I